MDLPGWNSRGVFAVGRRTNAHFNIITSTHPQAVSRLRDVGNLFKEYAEDYFITTSRGWLDELRTKSPKQIKPIEAKQNPRNTTEPLIENKTIEAIRNNSKICYTSQSETSQSEFDNNKSRVASNRDHRLVDLNCTNQVTEIEDLNNGHFRWNDVPDFVIGRPGYDNWLVSQAIMWNVTLAVDVTNTVLAMHQTGAYGIRSGLTNPAHRTTLLVNYKMAGEGYNYRRGYTICLPWTSKVSSSSNSQFVFVKREVFHKNCKNKQ